MIPEYPTTVLDIQPVARDTKKFIFSKPADWTYESGQFISLKFTERAFRAYSIASHPDEEPIELVIRLIEGGLGSTVLSQTKIGDEFTFRGAFGHFGLKKNSNTLTLEQGELPKAEGIESSNHLIFCATGTGIAPFRSMVLEEMKQNSPRTMTLLYGGRNADDMAYLDEIRTWSESLHICLAFSREESEIVRKTWAEKLDATVIKGRITDYLTKDTYKLPTTHQSLLTTTFYLCGNGDMVMSVRNILLEQGVEKTQIIQERFN